MLTLNILINFFEGTGGDYQNRTLNQMLRWSDEQLEQKHDYIQTLFPLPENSAVNYNAPLIDEEVFKAFQSREDLRQNLRKAFERILSFWGFRIADEFGQPKIIKAPNFERAAKNWVRRFDHNHLRITRVIRCLRVLSMEREALGFLEALTEVHEFGGIGDRSFMYWRRAALRPLNIAPDVEPNEIGYYLGRKFLQDFEENRVKTEAHSLDTIPTLTPVVSEGSSKLA